MTDTDLCDAFFVSSVIQADEMTSDVINQLAAGVVAAVQVKGFLAPALCHAAVERISGGDLVMEEYDRARVDPPIARFGPVINDFNAEGAIRPEYWQVADAARREWARTMASADPMEVIQTRLDKVWHRPVRPAEVGGRELFAGALREINEGALIHFDDIRREYGPDVFDSGPPIVQIAFNAWISTPEQGGTTTIWRRRWNPADRLWRRGYGFERAAVADDPSLSISVEVGDALLFDPRHFHAVAPSPGGRRIALTFFMGLTTIGELIIWS